jgi:hypothetical protein
VEAIRAGELILVAVTNGKRTIEMPTMKLPTMKLLKTKLPKTKLTGGAGDPFPAAFSGRR